MGQAQSSNYTNTVIGTYTKVVQDTNSTALQNSLNQYKISISGGTGNVNISNVLSKQTIKNDLVASFKSVNESSVLQKVSQEISQQASSLISGLNLGNFSESSNTINTAINASMDVSQTISTSCVSTAANSFTIEVKDRIGDININDNSIDQSIENSMTCATESLNKSIASQEIENKIAQKATAETKGLSLDIFGLIVAGVIVFMIIAAMVGSKVMALIGVILPAICVGIVEYFMYTKKLDPTQKEIEKLVKVMKNNELIFKQPKPMQQIRTFSYTCGLYGIGNYTGCFSSPAIVKTPLQNVSGCTFTEVPINATFSNPDQAFDYWLNEPDLNAIDIISKNNGASYDYHFYTKASKKCINLMEDLTKKGSTNAKIPELFCVMKDPVANSSALPTLSTDAGPTFVFTCDGFLYYTETDNTWKKFNTSSLFTATSTDNILISITPLKDTTVVIPDTATGDFFFIDMSNARENTNVKSTKYFYKIYKYKIGTTTRAPGTKFQAPTTSFTEHATLDVDELVITKKIGPFMSNPKVLSTRNYTAIFDPDIDIKAVQIENQEQLDKLNSEQKTTKILMGVLGGIGALIMAASAVSYMQAKNQSKS